MGLLEIRNVTKEFSGLVAVSDLDLDIEAGELRGLIGPNGSGKTTTLNLLSGWLRPTRGTLVWKGNEVTGLPPYQLARDGIGRTFQLPTLFRDLTCLQNVAIGFYAFTKWNIIGDVLALGSQRRTARTIEGKALALLELLDIADVKDELAGKLPLGYQRWLGIATALAIGPELLMLDEPLGGMNPVERKATMGKIRSLVTSGITVLLVEHDMHAVMGTCDTVTVMNAGRKIAEGPPEVVRNDQEVIEAYLGKDDVHA